MSVVGTDVPAWARANQACFEITPLVESQQGKKVQVGFNLTLYGRLPMDKTPGKEREAAGAQVWEGLREVVSKFAPEQGGSAARVEVEPPRLAAVLRPENELKPEISLLARVFHRADTFAEVTAEERDKLHAATKRLTDMGLKQGHW